MKKQAQSSPKGVQKAPETGHLDETLTEITTSTAHSLRKWRFPVAVVLVAVVAVSVAIWIVHSVEEGQKEEMNQRLYELFQGPLTRVDGYEPPADKVERLLADSRDTVLERIVAKVVADHYLDLAERLEEKIRQDSKWPPGGSQGKGAPASEPSGPGDTAKAANAGDVVKRDGYFEKATRVASDATARFGDDLDIQKWAAALRARVEGMKKTEWLPSGRSYVPLQLKPQGAGAAQPTAPGAAQPTAPGAAQPTAPGAAQPTAPGGPTSSESPQSGTQPPPQPPASPGGTP